jgi:hypothetical protein
VLHHLINPCRTIRPHLRVDVAYFSLKWGSALRVSTSTGPAPAAAACRSPPVLGAGVFPDWVSPTPISTSESGRRECVTLKCLYGCLHRAGRDNVGPLKESP